MQLELVAKRRKVQELIELLVDRKVFTMNSIKRALQVMVKEGESELGRRDAGMEKPEGTDVRGMFSAGPQVFQCGAEELPEGSHHLKVENMIGMHVESCPQCREGGV